MFFGFPGDALWRSDAIAEVTVILSPVALNRAIAEAGGT